MIPREDIAVAIFNLLMPIGPSGSGLVKTLGRKLVPAAQMNPANLPAIYQVQPNDGRIMKETQTLDNLYARDRPYEWVVYGNVVNGVAPSTTLNPILDAIEGVLPIGNNLPWVVDGVPIPIFWDANDVPIVEAVEGILDFSMALFTIRAYIPPTTP